MQKITARGEMPPAHNARILVATGIRAGYRGRPILHDVDLRYGPGLHILLGPNGAGKTTLFRVLVGVLRPEDGSVLVAGHDPHTEVGAKKLIGFAGHRAALVPRLSVVDNLRYWARVLSLPPGDREDRVQSLISSFALDDFTHQRAGTLSRGQSQRVAIAKALLSDPPLLILDEPTSGMDPEAASRLRKQLRVFADDGRTLLISTHELAEASDLADDVTILHHGKILAAGRPTELRRQLVGERYRIRVRGTGDLRTNLASLGIKAVPTRQGGVFIDVDDETAVENLVRELVRAGVGIREVSPVGSALEDVYLQLSGEDGGHEHG